MIDVGFIKNIVEEYLKGKDIFLVDVKITKNNVILVTIDGDNGVVVENCIEVSRFIEKQLNRDIEDFELTVTSFGLEEYFTMQRQYIKNIGENVEVILVDNEKINGILDNVEDDKIILTTKKQLQPITISFDNIKKARVLINFNKNKKITQ